ncbi:hypothetical protein [Anaerosporobacter faecicola]|uniref:hypothetical protein n=1 Tax=Anaerosporobacter faecicola TaxID=2718714 RepID=UPI00143A1AD0|nr:hypothetical protein [Anaerosporobacter faecicola]
MKPVRERERQECGDRKPACERETPRCGCRNEQMENEGADLNIILVNDCSCQEFMRMYDWYNCSADKAHREFMIAEKNLRDAMEYMKMGMEYNQKAKEIHSYMEEFLDGMDGTDDGVEKGCKRTCHACNCDPCKQMREEWIEMMDTLNTIENDSLKHTKEAITCLMDAQNLHRSLCQLKNKVANTCFPKC